MTMTALISAFVTLFVIIDPIGLVAPFITLTHGMTQEQRRAIARRACITAVGLLAAFGLLGELLLNAIGISMAAFRISGGLLLFLTALDMLFERRTERRARNADEPTPDPSVFPLAIPLIAGPGALTTMILLTSDQQLGWDGLAVTLLLMVVVVTLVYALCLAAGWIAIRLGPTGIMVITRLFGMLLAALSVQFVIDGLRQMGLLSAT